MFHYFEAITNTSGESLIGYYARVIDPATLNVVSIYADDSGTPIITVSGVENMAKTDDYGNLSFYLAPGTYHLDIFAPDTTTFRFRVQNVGMTSTQGIQGPVGPSGPANASYPTLAELKASDITNLTANLTPPADNPGPFLWTPGDFTGTNPAELNVNVIQSDHQPLSVGAWVRQITDRAYLRNFGADPTGTSSSVAAFTAALAAGRRVIGAPGDTYLLDSPVTVPSDREIIGNGASLKIGTGVIGLRLDNDKCKVSGWTIQGNGGLYAVLNTGKFNEFSDNLCTGNIGHFFFSTGAEHVLATNNKVDGLTADNEITTALVAENCKHITYTNNQFREIPKGWSIQVRDESEDFTVSNNNFLQTQWSDTKTATAGQTVFNFDIGSVCMLKKVQVNGLPLSPGPGPLYTITGTGPDYIVTFAAGRTAGEEIKLVGYRGAENIQINSGSKHGTISGNAVDGTGDSGIICHGSYITVGNNSVRNCGYAGIAIYGDQDNITVTGNIIADCAQMDDGQSSPDNPAVASVFAGAILASGSNASITGNTIINTPPFTMRYGIMINKTDMALRTDGSPTVTVTGNTFSGSFIDGRISAPNEVSGERVNSIKVDGVSVAYPEQINLDQDWTNVPPSTNYFTNSGFGGTFAIRDTSVKLGGVASLKTVAGEYADFSVTAAGLFRNCNVEVTFWAKAASGSSYVSVFTTLAGLGFPLTAEITDTNWRQYSITFPLTANLDDVILIRCGANSGSANIQNIQINGRRL